jgi:hypothetical protein
MKNLLSISFVLIMAVGLTACGDTQEEKNQKQLLGDSFKLLRDIGEMGQKGASSEEIGDKAMDGILGSLGKIRGENGEKLSDDELAKLREGMETGVNYVKEMEKMTESGESDEDISMNFFGKMAEMQLKHDKDMTDEEREDAEAAAEMFKDGGKKFKESNELILKKATEDIEAAHKEMEDLRKKDLADALTELKRSPKIALIALDGSTLASNMIAPKIGCNDMIIFEDLNKEMMPKEVLETLFNFADFDENEGYYNAFYSSSNLSVDNLSIDDAGVATVELSGNLQTGGMCDNPRVMAQIKQTIMVMKPMIIKDVKILINGELVEDFLSEKD